MFPHPQNLQQDGDQSFDTLLQIWIRFLIAFASLLAVQMDAGEHGVTSEWTRLLLITYCLGSACLVFVNDMLAFRELASSRLVHWGDMAVFLCLVAMTGGVQSNFFFFLFFPIIVASFSWGAAEGQRVTMAAAVVFAAIGLGYAEPSESYPWSEGMLRLVGLVAFGYMIAYWGGGRIVLKQRLGLLQKIGTEWNPRFGAHNGVQVNLVRLADFFHASRCILVLERMDKTPRFVMHASDRRKQSRAGSPVEIADTTAKELLLLPNTLAVAYENPGQRNLRSINRHVAYDVETQEPTDRYLKECENLSNLFDGESFISVPYKQPGVVAGRLYLIARHGKFFRSDIAFVKQAADVISSVVENMQLIEDLIAEAEGRERHRISLDVHDTTIQPYIGLTLALDALAMEFKDNEALGAKIGEIVRMANMTIHDLRSYKDILREKSLMRGEVLLSAVRNQAERMQHFYGIHLDVRGAVDPNLPGRLAEAAYQIIKEGISNILRHTNAKNAYVSLACADGRLLLEIGNEADSGGVRPVRDFMPKSISERAASLNGQTQVDIDAAGSTVVSVSIPNPKEQDL